MLVSSALLVSIASGTQPRRLFRLLTLLPSFPPPFPPSPGPEEDKAENARLFRSAGFYRFRDPAKKLRVLVLNSGLWSPRYDNADLPRSLPDAHMVRFLPPSLPPSFSSTSL